jgi:AraC-like DNA-binding protein
MKAVFEQMEHFNMMSWETVGFDGYHPSFHPHCELVMVIDGEIDMIIDGITHTVRAGEISVVFPYVTHCYQDAPGARVIVLLFDSDTPAMFESTLLSKKPACPYTDRLPHIENLFRRIIELREHGGALDRQVALSYLSSIIGEILIDMPLVDNDIDTPDVSKKILTYCAEHFADEDISIKTLTEALYISPSYVSKVFSRTIKCKFREYINILKVNRAKRLLKKKEMKMVGIMMACGFKNQSTFNRIFLDIVGVTPREYRKSCIE